MRSSLLFVTAVISHAAFCQIPAEKVQGMYINWSPATILLVSGEDIDCTMRFDQLNQNMEVRYQDHFLDIPFEDISAFNFYDSIKQERRFFEKIMVPSGKQVMMEYLFENETSAILQERFIRSFHMTYPSPTLERRDFFYTAPVEKKFLYHKATRKALVLSRQNLLVLLRDKKREINEFIAQNKLRFSNQDDYMTVLHYYDTL